MQQTLEGRGTFHRKLWRYEKQEALILDGGKACTDCLFKSNAKEAGLILYSE
jgi:hypothetical protein